MKLKRMGESFLFTNIRLSQLALSVIQKNNRFGILVIVSLSIITKMATILKVF